MNEAVYLPQSAPHPGDQPIKELIRLYVGSGPTMDIVYDIDLKLAAGEEKYGSPLMTLNGRSADLDAYQDILDTIVYSIQGYYEETNQFRKADRQLEIIALFRVAKAIKYRLVVAKVLEYYE
jgi:hypothetical protein